MMNKKRGEEKTKKGRYARITNWVQKKGVGKDVTKVQTKRGVEKVG